MKRRITYAKHREWGELACRSNESLSQDIASRVKTIPMQVCATTKNLYGYARPRFDEPRARAILQGLLETSPGGTKMAHGPGFDIPQIIDDAVEILQSRVEKLRAR